MNVGNGQGRMSLQWDDFELVRFLLTVIQANLVAERFVNFPIAVHEENGLQGGRWYLKCSAQPANLPSGQGMWDVSSCEHYCMP